MANTSIVTESARAAAAVNVEDYATSVKDHINGGWEKHRQLGLVVGAFPIGRVVGGIPGAPPPAGSLASDQVNRLAHEVASPYMLRLQVTRRNVANTRDELVEVLVPVVGWETASLGTTPPRAPVISYVNNVNTVLPPSTVLASGASITLRVALEAPSAEAAGDPVVYQWRKNLVNIVGETSNTLLVSRAGGASAAGDYQCLVAGFGGLTRSRVAVVTHA